MGKILIVCDRPVIQMAVSVLISEKTVNTYKARLLLKLSMSTLLESIEFNLPNITG
ncbi:MAG: hypothetical protein NVS3B11_19520 [Collimonas sp.]